MSNNDVGEAITMSQPEPGGAPRPEVNEKLASLEKLRFKVYELLEALRKVENAVDTRGYERALFHIESKLELLQLYYELVKIEQKVEGNKVAEGEWGALMRAVWEIEEKASKRYYGDERQKLLHAVAAKAKAVERKIREYAKKTEAWKKIEEELNMLREEIAGHEEEVLMREGVKG